VGIAQQGGILRLGLGPAICPARALAAGKMIQIVIGQDVNDVYALPGW